jgi:hypothetical protein
MNVKHQSTSRKFVRVAQIAALAVPFLLGLATSASAAMPTAPVNGDSGITFVDCAPGWYRGPGGACYILGTGPGYYYGPRWGGGGYYGRPGWRGRRCWRGPYGHLRCN